MPGPALHISTANIVRLPNPAEPEKFNHPPVVVGRRTLPTPVGTRNERNNAGTQIMRSAISPFASVV